VDSQLCCWLDFSDLFAIQKICSIFVGFLSYVHFSSMVFFCMLFPIDYVEFIENSLVTVTNKIYVFLFSNFFNIIDLQLSWCIYWRLTLWLLLKILENRVYFKLCPDKIGILHLVYDSPPKPSMNQTFNQIWIISISNINLIISLIGCRFDIHSVWVIYFPYKIMISCYFLMIVLLIVFFVAQSKYKMILPRWGFS